MRTVLKVTFLFFTAFIGGRAYAAITLDEKDATVWLPMQSITGRITGIIKGVQLYCNNIPYAVKVNADGTFKVTVTLADKVNKIWVTGKQNNATIKSGPLTLTMGYHPLPDVKPYAVVAGPTATLHATLIDDPGKKTLKYLWTAAKNNPAVCKIGNKNSAESGVAIPAKAGAYYFNLQVIAGKDTARFQTYITRSKEGLHAYNMDKDHAAWIDSAVVYEINPSVFVKNGSYDAITDKLGEIKKLGINTIWIQPICKASDKGQGYSVTDFFEMRTDLGTEKQLANLIFTAKRMGMRVLLDFVPNHTSVYHPYAQECLKYGDSSHYYNFYQHANDGKPYSSYYTNNRNMFISYFWKNLVNINYNNPEVQEWMIQAIKYWLVKFDLDGYRFDSMWGINARTPQFGKRLNEELKSIKPGLLLLAEEKSSEKIVYQNGFDAAYDWSSDTTWISQWAWATHYSGKKNFSIFNLPDVSKRSGLLQAAIFNDSSISNRSLRFIENNDQPRFAANHTIDQTKMAAALVFSLPGLPMVYNGQEIGCKLLPYSDKTIFTKELTIEQSDSSNLFPYYQKIIQLHSQYPALISPYIDEVQLVNSPDMMAFHRWKNNQHFIVIVNLDSVPANAFIKYNSHMQYLQGMFNFKDLLSGNVFKVNSNDPSTLPIPMKGYSIRWLLIKNQETKKDQL